MTSSSRSGLETVGILPVGFLPMTGPEDNDVADGVKAFNNVAVDTERNFDILNKFAPKLNGLYATPAVTMSGNALLTFADGWGWTGDFATRTFARTWLGTVYLYLLIYRSGPAIAASSRGNVSDQDVAYLQVPYQPPVTAYGNCIINNNFTAQCRMSPSGGLTLMGLSYGATIPTGSFLIFQIAWPTSQPS